MRFGLLFAPLLLTACGPQAETPGIIAELPTDTVEVEAAESNSDDELIELREEAEQGDAEAQLSLALRYSRAQGMSQDLEESVKWLRKAAEQHHPQAQLRLGVSYLRGWGVEKDVVEAYKWSYVARGNGEEPNIVESAIKEIEAALTPKQKIEVEEFKKTFSYQLKFDDTGLLPSTAEEWGD